MVLLTLLLFAGLAAAQTPPARSTGPVPSYGVKRASGPIVVDGKGEDAAWKGAVPIELQYPWESEAPKQKTIVRLLWDDRNLYLLYECDDADIVAVLDSRDDPTYKDDAVELFINPKPEQQDFYYGLEINARAVLYDYFYAFPKLLMKRFNMTGVQLASYVRGSLNMRNDKDDGWTMEVAIPWTNFQELSDKLPPPPGTAWAANLNRLDGVEGSRRLSMWSDSGTAKPSFHVPSRFGRLVFE